MVLAIRHRQIICTLRVLKGLLQVHPLYPLQFRLCFSHFLSHIANLRTFSILSGIGGTEKLVLLESITFEHVVISPA
jgi:hypothetical protein